MSDNTTTSSMTRVRIISHYPYSFAVDYIDAPTNALLITTANHETQEEFQFILEGELNGVVKFDPSTYVAYVESCWGRAFPGYDEKIGFIYSTEDLQIRRHLLTDAEYEALVTKYPKLPTKQNTLQDEEGIYQARVIEYAQAGELDIETGKVVKEGRVVIDNTEANWAGSAGVPFVDLREVATDMADTAVNVDPRLVHYFDPIEADIWRKYGKFYVKA